MNRRRWVFATLLGIALGAWLTFLIPQLTTRLSEPIDTAVLSDCDDPIRELAIHYTRASEAITVPAYRDFLTALPDDVTVRVVVNDPVAYRELVNAVGPIECMLTPVVVEHPITAWSRDRWLAVRDHDHVTLIRPWMELLRNGWPNRQGDERVAADLVKADPDHLRVERSPLYFDGGDFVADRSTVFVTPHVAARNVGTTVATRSDLQIVLTRMLGRRIVLLREAPPHHAGMFMMPISQGRMLVGDPSLAADMLSENAATLPIEPDLSADTQAAFDAVADQCREVGYEVIRMPIVPGVDGRTYLTWLNVILDDRATGRVVYMPVFDQAEELNRQASRIWASAGYRVVPVNCTTTYRQFGSLRCLVNVIDRGGPRKG